MMEPTLSPSSPRESASYRTTATPGATREDIVRLYRELLGREPESEDAVTPRIGMRLSDLTLEFATCAEHISKCRAATEADVLRLSKECLGRDLDRTTMPEGWCGQPILDLAIEVALCQESIRRRCIPSPRDIEEAWSLVFPDRQLEAEWLDEFARIVAFHQFSLAGVFRQLLQMASHDRGPEICADALARQGWPELSAPMRKPLKNIGRRVELVIPTRDSERWIGSVLSFYKRSGLDPIFAIDARTRDATRDIIAHHKCRAFEVSGPAEAVEFLLAPIAARVDCPWILRIDDDEIPTAALIDFVDTAAERDDVVTLGFGRAQLRYNRCRGTLERSNFIAFGPDTDFDCQWRMFRPADVRFEAQVHSPGFAITSSQKAPAEAQLLHFDWVLRDEAERRAKLARYEALSPIRAQECRHFTVPEIVPESWHIFTDITDEQLNAFARGCTSVAPNRLGTSPGT